MLRAEFLREKLVDEVYDTVSHCKSEDVWIRAEEEALKQFKQLNIADQALMCCHYIMKSFFNDIGEECYDRKLEKDYEESQPPDCMILAKMEMEG